MNQRFNPLGYPRNFESILESVADKNVIWPFTFISSNSGIPRDVNSPESFCCRHTNIGCQFKEYIQQLNANTGCQNEDLQEGAMDNREPNTRPKVLNNY